MAINAVRILENGVVSTRFELTAGGNENQRTLKLKSGVALSAGDAPFLRLTVQTENAAGLFNKDFIIAVSSSTVVNPPVSAAPSAPTVPGSAIGFDFVVNETQPERLEDIVFVLTGATAASYVWNFGDGTTSAGTSNNLRQLTYNYSTPGPKTVSLTVNGNQTVTKNNYITVISAKNPVYNFTANNLVPDTGTNVTFTATQSANSYNWYFGDGTTVGAQNQTAKSVVKAYETGGLKTVILVSNSANTVTKNNYINVSARPNYDIIVNNNLIEDLVVGQNIPLEATISASVYSWDLNNDGIFEINGADKKTVNFQILSAGTHFVKLMSFNAPSTEIFKQLEITNGESIFDIIVSGPNVYNRDIDVNKIVLEQNVSGYQLSALTSTSALIFNESNINISVSGLVNFTLSEKQNISNNTFNMKLLRSDLPWVSSSSALPTNSGVIVTARNSNINFDPDNILNIISENYNTPGFYTLELENINPKVNKLKKTYFNILDVYNKGTITPTAILNTPNNSIVLSALPPHWNVPVSANNVTFFKLTDNFNFTDQTNYSYYKNIFDKKLFRTGYRINSSNNGVFESEFVNNFVNNEANGITNNIGFWDYNIVASAFTEQVSANITKIAVISAGWFNLPTMDLSIQPYDSNIGQNIINTIYDDVILTPIYDEKDSIANLTILVSGNIIYQGPYVSAYSLLSNNPEIYPLSNLTSIQYNASNFITNTSITRNIYLRDYTKYQLAISNTVPKVNEEVQFFMLKNLVSRSEIDSNFPFIETGSYLYDNGNNTEFLYEGRSQPLVSGNTIEWLSTGNPQVAIKKLNDSNRYIINFGDGISASANNNSRVNHIYTSAGTYQVFVDEYDLNNNLLNSRPLKQIVVDNGNTELLGEKVITFQDRSIIDFPATVSSREFNSPSLVFASARYFNINGVQVSSASLITNSADTYYGIETSTTFIMTGVTINTDPDFKTEKLIYQHYRDTNLFAIEYQNNDIKDISLEIGYEGEGNISLNKYDTIHEDFSINLYIQADANQTNDIEPMGIRLINVTDNEVILSAEYTQQDYDNQIILNTSGRFKEIWDSKMNPTYTFTQPKIYTLVLEQYINNSFTRSIVYNNTFEIFNMNFSIQNTPAEISNPNSLRTVNFVHLEKLMNIKRSFSNNYFLGRVTKWETGDGTVYVYNTDWDDFSGNYQEDVFGKSLIENHVYAPGTYTIKCIFDRAFNDPTINDPTPVTAVATWVQT